jgi:hypothetical protein
MSNAKPRIHFLDCSTGIATDREMTPEEIAAHLKNKDFDPIPIHIEATDETPSPA